MDHHSLFILFVLFLAYVFEFINGFHDAANSIATIVTTGVLTPRQAVIWAAFFNFMAFLVFRLMVAKTIGNGLIDTSLVDVNVIFAALISAIFWNLVTWYYGLPSSSSHALIGGLAGAAIVKGGFGSLKLEGFAKVVGGIFLSPVLGLIIGLSLAYGFKQIFKNKSEKRMVRVYSGMQLFSSAMLSLTHGGNDAQKTMGVIAILLFSSSWLQGEFYVPVWVVLSCYGVISLGTLMGGWRIVRTMGTKITVLNPLKGCAAEAGAAFTIYAATECGVPISTTQTVTGSIAGVGLVESLNGTNWKIFRTILISWLVTIPICAMVAAAIMLS